MENKIEKTERQSEKKRHSKQLLVGVISLGCDKNRVDSEIMLSFLSQAGYRFTSDPSIADIIIINTCGFIASARDESMDAISEMIQYKSADKGRCKRLIVTGCMPQRWSNEMREEFPEVDVFLGIDQYFSSVIKYLLSFYVYQKQIRKSHQTIQNVRCDE